MDALRRLLAAGLAILLCVPAGAWAQDEDDEAKAEESEKPKKKAKAKAPAADEEDDDGEEAGYGPLIPDLGLPELSLKQRHRYAFVGGGVLLLAGLGFGYTAQGEAKRAETLARAREASSMLDQARNSAATANILLGMAAMTVIFALVLEFLPEPEGDRASLTFHF